MNTRQASTGARIVIALSICVSLALAGCGSGARPTLDRSAQPAPPSKSGPSSPSVPTSSEVVVAHGELTGYEQADTTSAVRSIAAKTELGSPTTLLVTERTEGWVQVLVPGRPNGSTAWLEDVDLDIQEIHTAIAVDLDARTLTLYEGGKPALEAEIAIGSPDAPTPTGRFSVTDELRTPDPSGAYGPFALGLSGRSEVVTEFNGGDGQIGIHGTDDPSSIGQAVSHGCIRLDNEAIADLSERVSLGTPVVVS